MHLNSNYINELLFTIKNGKLLVAPLIASRMLTWSVQLNFDLVGSVERWLGRFSRTLVWSIQLNADVGGSVTC